MAMIIVWKGAISCRSKLQQHQFRANMNSLVCTILLTGSKSNCPRRFCFDKTQHGFGSNIPSMGSAAKSKEGMKALLWLITSKRLSPALVRHYEGHEGIFCYRWHHRGHEGIFVASGRMHCFFMCRGGFGKKKMSSESLAMICLASHDKRVRIFVLKWYFQCTVMFFFS